MTGLSTLVNELAPYKRGQWKLVCLFYQIKMQREGITFEAKRKYSHIPYPLMT